jgi:hypothetical protein
MEAKKNKKRFECLNEIMIRNNYGGGENLFQGHSYVLSYIEILRGKPFAIIEKSTLMTVRIPYNLFLNNFKEIKSK